MRYATKVCSEGCVTIQQVLLQRYVTGYVTNVRCGSATDPSKSCHMLRFTPRLNASYRSGSGDPAIAKRAESVEAKKATLHRPSDARIETLGSASDKP